MTHPGDLLSAFLDGELTSAERRDVTSHLKECPACRDELEATAAMRSAVLALPVLDVPPGLLPEAEVVPIGRARRIRPAWAWAAAGFAAVAISVGIAAGATSGPEPMDLDTLADRHTARVLVEPGVQSVRAVVEVP